MLNLYKALYEFFPFLVLQNGRCYSYNLFKLKSGQKVGESNQVDFWLNLVYEQTMGV